MPLARVVDVTLTYRVRNYGTRSHRLSIIGIILSIRCRVIFSQLFQRLESLLRWTLVKVGCEFEIPKFGSLFTPTVASSFTDMYSLEECKRTKDIVSTLSCFLSLSSNCKTFNEFAWNVGFPFVKDAKRKMHRWLGGDVATGVRPCSTFTVWNFFTN